MNEVFSARHETSQLGGGKMIDTNKVIKIFCQEYTLVQFFEYNSKSISARSGPFS